MSIIFSWPFWSASNLHSNLGKLALPALRDLRLSRLETDGFAVKDRPNPVLPIFSRPYLFRQEAATQDLGFNEFGEDSQGSIGVNPKSWVAVIPGGIFFEIWS